MTVVFKFKTNRDDVRLHIPKSKVIIKQDGSFIEVFEKFNAQKRQLKARETHIDDIVCRVETATFSLLGEGDKIKQQFDPSISPPTNR